MPKATKLPSGNWRTQIYIGKDKSGKRKYKSFTADTKRESERSAMEFLSEQKGNMDFITLEKAMKSYIASREAVISPLTKRGYQTIEKMLKKDYGAFCEQNLHDIGKKELQNVVSDMVTEKKLSAKTVRNRIGFLSAVFAFYDIVFSSVKLPDQKKPELKIPGEEDVKKIIKLVEGTEMEIPVLLAAFGGLRRSEIPPLTMSDIEGNIIHVNKATVLDSDKNLVTKLPKTYEGTRYVEIPSYIIKKIKKQGYVTKINNPDIITNRFCRLMKENKMSWIHFHSLRHFNASYLHALGLPEKYIQQRLGWSSDATMKNIYRHALPETEKEMNKKVASGMEKFFK